MKGGRRSNAGRPGWHSRTASALQLDIRVLQREDFLSGAHFTQLAWPNGAKALLETNVDSVRIAYCYKRRDSTWHNVDERIPVTYTTCHFGGNRPWFTCPRCCARVGIIYLWHTPKCRKCARLVYVSLSEDAVNRSWRRTTKLEGRFESPRVSWRLFGLSQATTAVG